MSAYLSNSVHIPLMSRSELELKIAEYTHAEIDCPEVGVRRNVIDGQWLTLGFCCTFLVLQVLDRKARSPPITPIQVQP
jgi:hypothetical protein